MVTNDTTTTKRIYVIRHGESTYNEWRSKSYWNFEWIYMRDPMIIDAPLSERGEAQTMELFHRLKLEGLHNRIEYIICSPLTRAIQTTVRAFDGTNIPIHLEPTCRERLDTACDIGRQPNELSAEFAKLNADFENLDRYWWINPHHTPSKSYNMAELSLSDCSNCTEFPTPQCPKDICRYKESISDLDSRIETFLNHIESLPYKHIAVVGHSTFFKRLLGMKRKLKNCEMVTVDVSTIHHRVK